MRQLIKAQTRRGVQLDGVLFANGGEDTAVIAITGIHGNFYSNPMYYNIGDTLAANGIASSIPRPMMPSTAWRR